ncbi:hypothetical protein AMTR_s00047p00127900 [Amborella trichopoda]|uniref:Uncharacterized protein n=1 Tax=Amborella trichopoda TaxID=13333 RepID=U5D6A1_AMBTC|nr:hypothetical protein AMTR_s00047p00127900 [Amborella trichopoda]
MELPMNSRKLLEARLHTITIQAEPNKLTGRRGFERHGDSLDALLYEQIEESSSLLRRLEELRERVMAIWGKPERQLQGNEQQRTRRQNGEMRISGFSF